MPGGLKKSFERRMLREPSDFCIFIQHICVAAIPSDLKKKTGKGCQVASPTGKNKDAAEK